MGFVLFCVADKYICVEGDNGEGSEESERKGARFYVAVG